MLTAVAREQSVIEGGVMIAFDCQRVFQLSICFHIASPNVFVVLYKYFPRLHLGKQIICFPWDQSLSVHYYTLNNGIFYLPFQGARTTEELYS